MKAVKLETIHRRVEHGATGFPSFTREGMGHTRPSQSISFHATLWTSLESIAVSTRISRASFTTCRAFEALTVSNDREPRPSVSDHRRPSARLKKRLVVLPSSRPRGVGGSKPPDSRRSDRRAPETASIYHAVL